MSKWTYRVSKQTLDNGDVVFAIREFYSDKQGNLTSWTSEEIAPVGSSIDDLRWALSNMIEALDKEVIDIGFLKNGVGDLQ